MFSPDGQEDVLAVFKEGGLLLAPQEKMPDEEELCTAVRKAGKQVAEELVAIGKYSSLVQK